LKSEMHTDIVEYLTSKRRPQTLERNVEKVINSWSLDRFMLDSVQSSVDDDGDIVIEILLETPEELELPDDKRDVRIDVDFVLRFAEKEIQDASKGQQ